MKSIKLLDCTVRDGGYLNDWKFGASVLTEIVQRLINANIDYIELGFIDERRYYDENRSIFPNTSSISRTYQFIKKSPHTKLVAMIDYGTCDIKNIDKKENTILDGIRIIFKKEKMVEAINYCKKVKELGYEVFTQLVSSTTYNKDDLNQLIRLENELNPYCVSIVDTYGLMDFNEISNLLNELNKGLNHNIAIGFHAHNNLLLAFSNSCEFLSQNIERNLIADGTILGMGKGAGNSPIELLANYCNNYFGTDYNIDELLEGGEANIMKLFGRNNWGYSLKFLLASINRVHPNYVSDYISKNVLSITNLNHLLKEIDERYKLLYSKDESERKYRKYCEKFFSDSDEKVLLSKEITGRKVLLIGPGGSINGAKERIDLFVQTENPIVISINFFPTSFETNYLFITNSRRLGYLSNEFERIYDNDVKVIGTTNLTPIFRKFDYVFDYSNLIDSSSFARDSAIIMILKLLQQCNCKNVYLAGFDGYASSFEDDFVNLSNAYGWKEPYTGFLNSYIRNQIKVFRTEMNVSFITASLFEEED
ncbi:MAG: aldolase catalytic domain-containing protein [Bacilli bacterium]|nr:aldolase catalytic domain-containing protein [Bacilli bacterium]